LTAAAGTPEVTDPSNDPQVLRDVFTRKKPVPTVDVPVYPAILKINSAPTEVRNHN